MIGPTAGWMVGVGSAHLGLDADDLHVRQPALDRDGHPLASPPPPTGTIIAAQVVDVLGQLESERCLPGDDGGVVERVDERHAGLVGAGVCGRQRRPHRSSPPCSTEAP